MRDSAIAPGPRYPYIIYMQRIPEYPESAKIVRDFKGELYPLLNRLPEGISEFTFTGLYLFRNTYGYQLSWMPGKKLLIRGEKNGRSFYSMPMGFPDDRNMRERLLDEVDYVKNLGESHADDARVWLESIGYNVCEDRDNFDYLYLREDLATLRGKKYHKKRNQVNAFINNYSYEERPLCSSNIDDAFSVLETWREGREDDGDYDASREALELKDFLGLDGYMVYVDGKPAAYTMGEGIANNSTYVIHIEKAAGQYRGIYQFINQAYASVLHKSFQYINREQDLGDEGLRQAKMTYRPAGFIKKYRVCTMGSVAMPFHTLTTGEAHRYAGSPR
jgi:hypothetical protein